MSPTVDRESVLAWGEAQRRDLPWRRTRDPWAVLVSEVMLQQTQVDRVVPAYHDFLSAFPTAGDCAAATLGEVLTLWSGLGYPLRARNLHRTAGLVVVRHGGSVPDDLAELLALPGIGPYTARAVLAFAFERDAAVVDTNVGRVLARCQGRRLGTSEAQHLADASMPPGRSWAWNQAMLDLGSLCCSARRPACGGCPISADCAWNRAGHPDPDPALRSAGVSGTQSAFAGSARQARGAILRAVQRGPTPLDRIPEVVGWDDRPASDAVAVAESLLVDGLVELRDGRLVLPGATR